MISSVEDERRHWVAKPRARTVPWACYVGLLLCLAPRPALGACAGDCAGQRTVGVENVIALVNILLGEQDLAACEAGDSNGDGQIQVSELILAVGNLLRGCSAEVDVPAAYIIARGMASAPLHALTVSAAFSAAGGVAICDLGGSIDHDCVADGGFARITLEADECRVSGALGAATLTGSSVVSGGGQCPDAIAPFGLTVESEGVAALEDLAGNAVLNAHTDARTVLESFVIFPDMLCRVRGATSRLDGTIAYETADQRRTTIVFDDPVRSVTSLEDLPLPSCDPNTIAVNFSGAVHITDGYVDPPVTVDTVLDQFEVRLRRADNQVLFNGNVDSPAFGAVTISTVTPLSYVPGQSCFTSGTLGIQAGSTQALITFKPDTAIEVDSDADGDSDETISNCEDL